jgi:hypothetical protein
MTPLITEALSLNPCENVLTILTRSSTIGVKQNKKGQYLTPQDINYKRNFNMFANPSGGGF